MKRILVPCDFSAPAQEAFKFAVNIAQRSKGEVDVLFILDITFIGGNPTLSYNYAFNVSFLKAMEDEAEADFQKMRRRFAPLTLPVTFIHRIGTLVPDIENYVRETGIDLIVMGTHGRGEAAWGSNTEKVVRNAPVPVVAVHHCPDGAISNIVVPILPGHRNKDFLEHVKNLQSFFGATLHLLWVNTPRAFKSDVQIHSELTDYSKALGVPNYTLNTLSDYSVEEGILRFAAKSHPDMIAMATHARKGLNHFFNGSVAEDVVNAARFPVWIYALTRAASGAEVPEAQEYESDLYL